MVDEVLELDKGRQSHFVEIITMLLGIWLAVSPFVLRFERATPADVVDLAVGVIVAVVAYHQLRQRIRRPGWSFFCAILGLLEMASPWAFGYMDQPAAVWQAVLFGGLIAIFAFWSGCSLTDWRDWGRTPRRRPGHGHRRRHGHSDQLART